MIKIRPVTFLGGAKIKKIGDVNHLTTHKKKFKNFDKIKWGSLKYSHPTFGNFNRHNLKSKISPLFANISNFT